MINNLTSYFKPDGTPTDEGLKLFGSMGTSGGSVAWGDVTGKPSTFTPSAHTHPLSNLTQSGATTGQFVAWNGTAWAPADVTAGGDPGIAWFI